MRTSTRSALKLHDFAPHADDFCADVLAGLQQQHKSLPCKYLYDERGSELFERICELPEYYPTRTELAIMDRHVDEMVELIGPGCLLIEYGSGSSMKTRWLLDHLEAPAGYVPIDISGEHLLRSAEELAECYPDVEVLPVCADFNQTFAVPAPKARVSHNVIYFPGSTIGNFTPVEAVEFLRRCARLAGNHGGMLLGADLKKDVEVLEAAYNDEDGVTAAFNMNLLARINRELDADFDLDHFEHRAVYNAALGRVESYLVSLQEQTVRIDGTAIAFTRGEAIHTENSHKFDLGQFRDIATTAGLDVTKVWTDDDELFSVQYLTVR